MMLKGAHFNNEVLREDFVYNCYNFVFEVKTH